MGILTHWSSGGVCIYTPHPLREGLGAGQQPPQSDPTIVGGGGGGSEGSPQGAQSDPREAPGGQLLGQPRQERLSQRGRFPRGWGGSLHKLSFLDHGYGDHKLALGSRAADRLLPRGWGRSLRILGFLTLLGHGHCDRILAAFRGLGWQMPRGWGRCRHMLGFLTLLEHRYGDHKSERGLISGHV